MDSPHPGTTATEALLSDAIKRAWPLERFEAPAADAPAAVYFPPDVVAGDAPQPKRKAQATR